MWGTINRRPNSLVTHVLFFCNDFSAAFRWTFRRFLRKSRRGAPRRLVERPTNDSEILVVCRIAGRTGARGMHVAQLDGGGSVNVIRNADNQAIVSALGFTGGTVLLINVSVAPVGV